MSLSLLNITITDGKLVSVIDNNFKETYSVVDRMVDKKVLKEACMFGDHNPMKILYIYILILQNIL